MNAKGDIRQKFESLIRNLEKLIKTLQTLKHQKLYVIVTINCLRITKLPYSDLCLLFEHLIKLIMLSRQKADMDTHIYAILKRT